MKKIVGYYDEEYIEITLYIYVEDSRGYISLDNTIMWDNLDFFIRCSKEEFKAECKKDCKQLGFKSKEIFRVVKELIKEAQKDGYLLN